MKRFAILSAICATLFLLLACGPAQAAPVLPSSPMAASVGLLDASPVPAPVKPMDADRVYVAKDTEEARHSGDWKGVVLVCDTKIDIDRIRNAMGSGMNPTSINDMITRSKCGYAMGGERYTIKREYSSMDGGAPVRLVAFSVGTESELDMFALVPDPMVAQ